MDPATKRAPCPATDDKSVRFSLRYKVTSSYTGSSPITFAKAIEITTYLGDATLLSKLVLRSTGYIRITNNNGMLKINP